MTCRTHQRNVAKNTVIILLIIRLTFHNLLSLRLKGTGPDVAPPLHKCTNYKECILFFFGQLLCAIEMTLAGGNSLGTEGS